MKLILPRLQDLLQGTFQPWTKPQVLFELFMDPISFRHLPWSNKRLHVWRECAYLKPFRRKVGSIVAHLDYIFRLKNEEKDGDKRRCLGKTNAGKVPALSQNSILNNINAVNKKRSPNASYLQGLTAFLRSSTWTVRGMASPTPKATWRMSEVP